MPAPATLALFLLAALGLLLFPGPAVLYIVSRSISQGRRAGVASMLGVEIAGLVHTVAAAFGLSALLLASALAFSVVKYLGAAYLIYLGIRAILSRKEQQEAVVTVPTRLSRLLTQGFLVNILNPKTALFFYAFLPQFVDPTRGTVIGQILLFGVLFVALATCTDGLYALLGSSFGHLLHKSTRIQRGQRYVTGGIYIVLGITTALLGSEKK